MGNIKNVPTVLLLLCCAQPLLGQGEGKTLRQVLASENVSVDATKLTNLDKRITSGATLNDSSQMVIAYYLANERNDLNPPLFIDRYDRKRGEWITAALGASSGGKNDLDDSCTGSVERIESIGAHLAIETHLNPSAGCTLLFSKELKLDGTLFGWLVGQLGEDELIYERNQVHFAPVHPTEIAIYSVGDKRDATIFPREPHQSVWRARVEQLRQFYASRQSWCQANNDPCDPEQFDSALVGDVAANEKEGAGFCDFI